MTGSRAEYGQLRWVMEGFRKSPKSDLQLAVTGMHLSQRFGLTYREIERDGFRIDSKVDTQLDSDSPEGIANSMGIGLARFGQALAQLRPHLMVVLGDRYEMLPPVIAAMLARIPIAHLHGGELTEGAFDESIRHAITKMAHLHFVAAVPYRNRVIQLGESPERVFMVGGLGVDTITRTQLLGRAEIEDTLGLRFWSRNLLITFHPPTLDSVPASIQLAELFAAVESLQDTQLIFTLPNADTGSRELIAMIYGFVQTHANARVYTSLGQTNYLSCLRYVDGVVGNSSSGLAEVPTFRKGTINIGDRQTGRLKAASVIDCAPERHSIRLAVERLYSAEFQELLATITNPYGEGGASEKVVEVINDYPLETLASKPFYDLEVP